jgi:hypothetical protein
LKIFVSIISLCSFAFGFGSNSFYIIRLNVKKPVLSRTSQKFMMLKVIRSFSNDTSVNKIKQMSTKYTKTILIFTRGVRRYTEKYSLHTIFKSAS